MNCCEYERYGMMQYIILSMWIFCKKGRGSRGKNYKKIGKKIKKSKKSAKKTK
jgi:hypothetical protein